MSLVIADVIQPRAAAPAPRAPRDGRISFHDTCLLVWEDGRDMATMNARVLQPLCRKLERMGWTIGADPKMRQRYPTLAPGTRIGRKGDLEIRIELHGRNLQATLFQNLVNVSNPNGGFYDFDKLDRMPYLLRLQALHTLRALSNFLHERHGYPVEPPEPGVRDVRHGRIAALDYIAGTYAGCWHTDPELGRPRITMARNAEAADGGTITHGAPVWFTDDRGRWQRGRAYVKLNNMWWVSANASHLSVRACFDLHTKPPVDPRARTQTRSMRARREQHLRQAVQALDTPRARILRTQLYGEVPLFRIWSAKRAGWYRTNAQGYTETPSDAGLYPQEEAAALIEGIDHLQMVPAAQAA